MNLLSWLTVGYIGLSICLMPLYFKPRSVAGVIQTFILAFVVTFLLLHLLSLTG